VLDGLAALDRELFDLLGQLIGGTACKRAWRPGGADKRQKELSVVSTARVVEVFSVEPRRLTLKKVASDEVDVYSSLSVLSVGTPKYFLRITSPSSSTASWCAMVEEERTAEGDDIALPQEGGQLERGSSNECNCGEKFDVHVLCVRRFYLGLDI